jgi:murein DD-endopeptidase MepM/ murein hydrolase activator NlpD
MRKRNDAVFEIILITLLAFSSHIALAQADIKENLTQQEIVTILGTGRKLVVDKVTTKLETSILDSILMMKFEIDERENLFPADDLYAGVWNNRYVRDYSGVEMPDSFRIDLSNFVMPFEGRITSHFGPRRRQFHYGTDIKVLTGDTIVAAFEGRVRVRQYERRGYGYYLVLRHPNGLETVYGHLSKFLVELDENVKAGQPIGLGGNTGRSTGSHLHFECRFLGQAIDPADIVDFVNFGTYDDTYLFQKSKINRISANNRNYRPSLAQDGSMTYHRVRSGDTLSGIAKRYRVTVAQLCRLNGITPTTVLRIGRVLRTS